MSINRTEATRLVNLHQENLSLQTAISNTAQAAADNLRHEVSLQLPQYQQALQNELFENAQITESQGFEGRLLVHLAVLRKLTPLADQVQRVERAYGAQIRQYIRALESVNSWIRWFFSGRVTKALAEEAYRQLTQLATGPAAEEYSQIRERFQSATLIGEDEALLDFEYDRAGFQRTFMSAYGTPPEATPPRLKQLLEQIQRTEDYVQGAKAELLERSSRLRELVVALQRQSAVVALEQIPLDTLRQDIARLRVKTLEEHGYRNAQDIYQAQVRELSSISGISEAGARELKSTVTAYLSSLESNTSIRIDPDNRTPEMDEIISCAYQVLRLKQLTQAVKTLSDNMPEAAKKSLFWVKGLSAPAWALLDATQKLEVRESVSALERQYLPQFSDLQTEYYPVYGSPQMVRTTDAWADFLDDSISYYNLLESLIPGILGNQDSTYGLPEDLVSEISAQSPQLDGLDCTLRRYQEWGVKYVLNQGSAILGDEMGLGKTIQALAVMVALRNSGHSHFVVVCPAAVLVNWVKEVSSKSDLPVWKVHGPKRDEIFEQWMTEGGVAVTTYETTKHFVFKSGFEFGMLIVDEAHYVKNPEAQRTQAMQDLAKRTKRHLFMTGTALENQVSEMITLVEMLRPRLAENLKSVAHMMTADIFREQVASVYLRRKREDVLGELPDLIQTEEWCELTRPEWLAYNFAAQDKSFSLLRRVSWQVEDLRLSQKANRLLEIVDQARADNRKVIVFSFFLDTIANVQTLLGEACMEPITGAVPPERRQEIVDEFGQAPAGSVLVAQIQSGGTGLNIQAASVVVFCEPQLKPSIEEQAISRAYRMGQARNVMVHRLLTEHSVDERIMEILAAKQKIFDAFADESVAADRQAAQQTILDSGAEGESGIDTTSQGEILRAELERISADNAEMFA